MWKMFIKVRKAVQSTRWLFCSDYLPSLVLSHTPKFQFFSPVLVILIWFRALLIEPSQALELIFLFFFKLICFIIFLSYSSNNSRAISSSHPQKAQKRDLNLTQKTQKSTRLSRKKKKTTPTTTTIKD